ncbi:phosphodiesterase [Cellulomonas sp. H30R-01]|uniref:DUF5998 family protein n=1 Tax=Cellulomonas sp. H30R-01 TaxID=2704467 RepID=UPI00138C8B7C|nr:DUF5998 family protein [Cellulomonas sp. H30R-01]QHT55956.1 phosphodiesterase [Cellulomonas sp. H30R-01]
MGAVPAVSDDLRDDLHRAGYYPELVADVLGVALADEPVVAHLVHPETTFDASEVRRHVTVLVLTPSRLVVAHVDDQAADSENPSPSASATTEAVPLAELRSVALTHVMPEPERHRAGTPPTELTLAIGWGAVSRVDLEPATCGDPACEADHGLTGTLTPDDVVVRVSAAAEGVDSVRAAAAFARQLSAASAHGR